MARTQAVTILFCDLVASTERRARLGDDAFDEFSARFLTALRDAIDRAGGREVSSAGDGLMVVFTDSVADAVSCAMEMHEHVRALDAADPPLLRVGISCGEVAQDGDNYSGMPIVEAARLESAAAPGQRLANHVVRALVGNRRALRFRDVGALTLKGIPEPLATVEVVHEDVADLAPLAPAPTASAVRPRRRAPIVAAVAIVVVIAVIAGVVLTRGDDAHHTGTVATRQGIKAPTNYTPRYEPGACPAGVVAAVPEATCGTLVVPQDRSHPDGKQVRLLVQQAPARVPGATKHAPFISVCGCDDLATSVARDHERLILMGARGYSNSVPTLTCPEVAPVMQAALAKPTDDPASVAKETAAIGACYARLVRSGVDPAQYNFDASALDLLDLMVALHIHQADLGGSDLNSAVVFGALRRAPGAVRSITLDNPAPPGQTALSDPIGDLAHAFERFVAQCDASKPCAKGYPDLGAAYRAAWQRAQSHPQLVSASTPDDSTKGPIPILMDGPRIADALATALGDPTAYSLVPAAITTDAATPLIATELLKGDYYVWHADAPTGAELSYFCAYDVHTADPNAVALAAQQLPQFRSAQDVHWTQWCSAWKVPDRSAVLSSDLASPVPALLLRGDISPSGSQHWITIAQTRLSNATAAVFPTLGNALVAAPLPCLARLRRTFLANPTADLDGSATQCEGDSTPINFDAPAG